MACVTVEIVRQGIFLTQATIDSQVDNGKLSIGSQVELGYLEQTAVSGSDRTVWEEARSRMTALIEAEADIEAASAAASSGSMLCQEKPTDSPIAWLLLVSMRLQLMFLLT